MIFSNHMAAFPPPSSSSSSTSPFIISSDHGHHHPHDMAMMMRQSMSFDGGVTEHGPSGFLYEGGNEINHGIPNNGDGDLSDDGSQMMLGEKKKRLSVEQVKALERSFETGNKLEPERKAQLARSLGLQPRQVAIWFQNRRARWKTKQLERDYEVLKRQLEILKSDNDALHSQNEKLHAELMAIKATEMNGRRADGGSSYWCNNGRSDVSCDINLDISRTSVIDNSLTLKLDPHHHHNHNNSSVQDNTCNNLCDILGNGGTGVVDEHREFWPWTMAADHHQLHES